MIWTFHGFLGQASDWDFLANPMHELGTDLCAFEMFGGSDRAVDSAVVPLSAVISGPSSMADDGAKIAEYIAERDREPILLGYSMGGRVALHVLLALEARDAKGYVAPLPSPLSPNVDTRLDRGQGGERGTDVALLPSPLSPNIYSRLDHGQGGERGTLAAIIVSAGLGIRGEDERVARQGADEDWARRFETEDWSELLRSWNALPVFGGEESRLMRIESAFDRKALAEALRRWSPAMQAPLDDLLYRIDVPVLWIAGQRDTKYVNEGRRAVERLPRGTLWIAPQCGHRVPWEQPQAFAARLGAFLKTLSTKGT